MRTLNCVLIEDQIPAQETLKAFIKQTPHLHLLGAYISPLEALANLENGEVDLLFLDIHLPKLNGIELLRTLKTAPQTIITTAFSKYAIEGYDLNVVDYLLKPFSFERFLKAVAKVRKTISVDEIPSQDTSLFVRNKGQIKKIELSAIQFIESKGDFVIISMANKREIANSSLQKLQAILGKEFIRCHKSYIININCIERIIGNYLLLNGKEIPIGRTYKENLFKRIKLV